MLDRLPALLNPQPPDAPSHSPALPPPLAFEDLFPGCTREDFEELDYPGNIAGPFPGAPWHHAARQGNLGRHPIDEQQDADRLRDFLIPNGFDYFEPSQRSEDGGGVVQQSERVSESTEKVLPKD
ncbi:hypothetical protein [Variovorax sp. WDL1]|nr:hypothetical protein [Variovorax sp. WDL1]